MSAGTCEPAMPGGDGRTLYQGVVFLLLGWALVFVNLHVDWSINPQYAYGWIVPLLLVGLLIRRWRTRPEPTPWEGGSTGLGWLLPAMAVVLPIRLIEEANPEWRMVLWAHALQASAVGLWVAWQLGGRAWLRHFAFPLVFPLIAVPWPMAVEVMTIQGLMRAVTAATVEIATLLSIPALQHGNTIEIGTGLVGVDEACSGVRSLQTSLLASLVLGELTGAGVARRCLLVFLAPVLALAANLVRTTVLLLVAHIGGASAIGAWHDPTGAAVALLVLPILALAAWGLRQGGTPDSSRHVAKPGYGRRIPGLGLALGLSLVWLVAVEVATEGWYRRVETDGNEDGGWRVVPPEAGVSGLRTVEIAEAARAMLRFNEGRAMVWRDRAGHVWKCFDLRWAPGRNSAQLANSHTPDICLTGTGFTLEAEEEPFELAAGGSVLRFRQFVFSRSGVKLFVFYCLSEHGSGPVGDSGPADVTMGSRIRSVLEARRHRGQQVLTLAVRGPDSIESARAELRSQLGLIITSRPPADGGTDPGP